MAELKISWTYAEIETDVSNTSAFVASSLAQSGEVSFDSYTLTSDNKETFLEESVNIAIDSLIPHFNRVISDDFDKLSETGEYGFLFTPRIEDGAYSKADFTYIKKLCKRHIVGYILKEWYALKGVVAMRDYFIADLVVVDKELDELLVRFVRPVRRKGVSIRNVTIEQSEECECEDISTNACLDFSNIIVGSDVIMSFKMSPVHGKHLSECSFTLKYYTNSVATSHSIPSTEAIKKSDDEYEVTVETDKTGAGHLKCLAEVSIPLDNKTIKVIKNLTTTVTIDKYPE